MDYHGSSVDHVQSQASGVEKVSSGWHKPTHSRSSSTASSRHSRLVCTIYLNLTGENMQDANTPGICEGYWMKRRKWPLKGWHKRYFVLDKGILRYSKNQHDFSKGKMHGALDVSLAVMSVNKKARRIDLDAGDILYHMKVSHCIVAMASRKYRASLSKAPPKLNTIKNTGRRAILPAVCPDNSHVGLMTILYNNIGKDLSRVSMPAALNEPVCLLQRLCEELEYSDLLDTANHTDDPYQRMVYIAAFAISGYATAQYRNRYKPFNPVLGETFECIREDRGFRYISEQVSHHPPISACHAESDNFNFWQDQRWKNKFWGKSLEIMPTGMVNVTLKKYGEHYEWNKVVTCIHNVLSQQRYLEHYGEVIIRNLKSSVCTCKITFVKVYGSKNEVQGQVLDETGNVVHRFGGFWHEGIFCDTLPNPQCIWKPNPQPKNYMLYYGFSRFAIEMNELTPDLKPLLPPTDTRLRPDQRLLEEGKIEETDKKKDEVEENQREWRKILAKRGEEHIPRFFRKTLDAAGREVWLYNGTYWKIRENPGFVNVKNLELW
uniref:Oxysterol-binding protein n=1 Tax=Sinocyclocheilus anshuiensis TaxID=1608454 RepID=A0A671PJR6_9TELE